MRTLILFLSICGFCAWSGRLEAAPGPQTTIDNAKALLDELAKTPEKCVPPALVQKADAIIVAPDIVKGGFVIAGRHGHGLLLIRQKDGSWSNPVFVTFTGGSIGLQVGIEKTDLLLIVRSQRSLERIMHGNGKLTLGADASIAAGTLGREALAATDAALRAEILAYSHSHGVFAGVAIEGDTLRIDWKANEQFYGKRELTIPQIVEGQFAVPQSALTLRSLLATWPNKPVPVPPPLPMPIPGASLPVAP